MNNMNKDDTYWQQKIQFFLHDPIDKALKIPGHEERAKRIAEAFGETTPEKNAVSRSDVIAAWLDRAALPGHSKDKSENGAIDFSADPILTHPISGGNALELEIAENNTQETTQAIIDIIEKDTNDNYWSKKETFNYLFFILKKRLVVENAAGLGYMWERLPADSRIPDHSIWNHCSMVSALGSCFAESHENNVSLVVFSVTPVQPFIAKTRKLKDHWVASVILSWLSFEGIAAVMDVLGPDHVIYPSLNDQPLVELMLKNDAKFNVARMIEEYNNNFPLQKDNTIASLPNKFVFLAPLGQEEEYVKTIEQRISQAWGTLAEMVRKYLVKKGGFSPEKAFNTIFNRQINNYWGFEWSSSRLLDATDKDSIEKLFEKEKFETVFQTIADFSKKYPQTNTAYQVSHSLAQTVLAVSKSRPGFIRPDEPGEKCPVCGEFEILHNCENSETVGAKKYKGTRDKFWTGFDIDPVILKDKEKLCSICAVKRLAPYAVKNYGRGHILETIFKEHNFPSTTEMALTEFFDKLTAENLLFSENMKQKLADELHEEDEGSYSNDVRELLVKAKKAGISRGEQDKYYAILVMDGDKMGELVNGRNIASKWQDVLHPTLVSRLCEPNFDKGIWQDYLDKQRLLSPAVHTAISESLCAFSLYAVPQVIKECKGRLIYAGGDDIVAVLPRSTVFAAAKKITELYRMGFVTFTADGIKSQGDKADSKQPLSFFLGGGDKITISGAILIGHHKQPLRGAIEDAHNLLKTIVKDKHGRDALAVKLQKRSGHSRIFAAQWNEINQFADQPCTKFQSFQEIMDAAGDKLLGSSLIYHLNDLKTTLMSILGKGKKSKDLSDELKDKIKKLIAYEVGHSGILDKKFPGRDNKEKKKLEALRLAGHLAGLILSWNTDAEKRGEMEFDGEIPLIAAFLSK